MSTESARYRVGDPVAVQYLVGKSGVHRVLTPTVQILRISLAAFLVLAFVCAVWAIRSASIRKTG
jgi:hypothetical protein